MADNWYGGGSSSGGGYSWDRPSSDWYAGSGGGGPYSWSETPKKPKPKSTGGFLGSVGHLLGQTLDDLETAAVEAPGGLYHLGRALTHDVFVDPWTHRHDEGFRILPHTTPIVKGMAESTAADLRHPLRHPGYTLLDLIALGSLGAGSASRIGAAGRASRAGEGASAVARSLIRAPEPPPRVFQLGGLQVQGLYSRNPALRGAQRLLDRARVRFPEAPLGRRLPSRIGFELGERRRILESVERAPAEALAKRTKYLTLPQQTALRVVAEGQPIESRVAFHERKLAEGVGSAAGHRKQIRLLQAARKYVDESSGKPRIDPGHAKLDAIYEETRALARERERLLEQVERAGAVSEGRVHAPGRVIEGARFESGAARRSAERRLARAETSVAKHERRTNALLERFARSQERTRPLTIAEAEAQIARTERRWNQLIEAKTAHLPGLRQMVVHRNRANRKLRNRGRPLLPTVKEEARAHAAKEIYASLSASEHPAAKRFLAELDEADRLREGLLKIRGQASTLLPEEGIPATRATASIRRELLGTAQAPSDVGLQAVVRHEQRRLVSQQRRREAAREALAGTQARGFVGAEEFAGGEFRVPYETSGAPSSLARHGHVGAGGSVGAPKAPGSIVHSYEGKVLEHGKFRSRTTQLVAESYVEAQRFAALIRARDKLIRAAHDAPVSRFEVPIRLDELKGKSLPSPVREFMKRYAEGGKVAGHEADALGLAYEVLRREVFPDPETLGAVEGVKWVDKRLLGDLNKPNPLTGVRQHGAGRRGLATFDAINDASRAAILLLKPAYAVPNLLGNAALNIVQQGFAAPRNLARAAHLNATLSRPAAAAIDGAMGEGFASALRASGKANVAREGMNALARVWSALVDTGFRRSSFLYEARRAGFKSAEDLERLTSDAALREQFVSIARRANREIIDYGRLGPFEREIVRRLVFFMPWLKGSTIYAARMVGEHPVIAAFVGQLGELGLETRMDELGPVPSFAEGIFKVGQRGKTPLVANPASVSILQTPAQLAETAREFLGGDVRPAFELSNLFTPVPAAVSTAVSGRDPFTGYVYPTSRSRVGVALEQLYGGLPQVTLAQRLRMSPAERAGRLYPYSDRDAWMQFLLGGIAPRPVNLQRLRERAVSEGGSTRAPGRIRSSSSNWYPGH
jgi:hypothetical protein